MRNNIAIGLAAALFALSILRYGMTVEAPGVLGAFFRAHEWHHIDWMGLVVPTLAFAMLCSVQQVRALARKVVIVQTIPAVRRLRMAKRNPQTGLATRAAFDAKAATLLSRGQPLSVLLVGVDGFKRINTEFGLEFGDGVLQRVGERLRGVMADPDAVSHCFSDEFAILSNGMAASGEATALALQISRAFDAPIVLNDKQARVSVSIGIAEAPRHGADLGKLMQAASQALRDAKLAGGAIWRTYDDAMHDTEAALRAAIPGAVRNREIVPFYQPILDLASGRVVGMEVLARWRHPTRGLLLPGAFIDLADRASQLSGITHSLICQVGVDAARWPDHDLFFAFNIAPNQLRDVLAYATMHPNSSIFDLAPEKIEIELTESALIKDLAATVEVVRVLRQRGVRVALADFGAGQGNYRQLSGIPLDVLKIGREFVVDMLVEPRAEFCVRSVAELGKRLGVAVTAEGVSTPEILRQVAAFGCRFVQGSLFSMPVAAADVPEVLRTLAGAIGKNCEALPTPGRAHGLSLVG